MVLLRYNCGCNDFGLKSLSWVKHDRIKPIDLKLYIVNLIKGLLRGLLFYSILVALVKTVELAQKGTTWVEHIDR